MFVWSSVNLVGFSTQRPAVDAVLWYYTRAAGAERTDSLNDGIMKLPAEAAAGGARHEWGSQWFPLQTIPHPPSPSPPRTPFRKENKQTTNQTNKKNAQKVLERTEGSQCCTQGIRFCASEDAPKIDLHLPHLSGMSFGTSISRDFMWRILMSPSIPLAATTSQASSYMVLESSQA